MRLCLWFFIITMVLTTPYDSVARKAEPGSGIRLNQSLVFLPDGRVYLLAQKKIVCASRVLIPEEIEAHRNRLIQLLNRQRNWNSGVPAEEDFLADYLKNRKKGEARRRLFQSLLQENWFRCGLVRDPREGAGCRNQETGGPRQ